MRKFELVIPYAFAATEDGRSKTESTPSVEASMTMPQSSIFSLPSSVNDFAFKIATVNGTGSASANNLLMQSIFRMGIPVSGKNIFPSNIQGLPTWYDIRVSKDGYTARPPEIDLVVALNTGTYAKDIATVRPGGYLLYDSSWPLEQSLQRDDITMLGVPLGRMCVEAFERDRDRTLLRNIAYAGALAALLDIDMDVDPRGAAREVRQEEVAARRELHRHPARVRLRQGALRVPAPLPPRADERERGLRPHRRQHRARRSARCTPARPSAHGIRSRPPRR